MGMGPRRRTVLTLLLPGGEKVSAKQTDEGSSDFFFAHRYQVRTLTPTLSLAGRGSRIIGLTIGYPLPMPDWAFHWIGYTLAVAAAIMIAWSFFADRARGRVRCRKCWYDLAGLETLPATCPECGKAHTKPRHLRKTRRHKRLVLLCMLVMLVGGYGLWVVPRVQDEGWYGVVPSVLVPWCLPHTSIASMPDSPRWQDLWFDTEIRWQSDDGRRGLDADMRWWLRLGLVDPAGYYGKTGFTSTADIYAQPYSWTVAGHAFQQFLNIDQLPEWARNKRIENEISELSLYGELKTTESGVTLAYIENGFFPLNLGDYKSEVSILPHPDITGHSTGELLIVKNFGDHNFKIMENEGPMLKLVLQESPSGVFRVRATVKYDGELIGVYDIDLKHDPNNGGLPLNPDCLIGMHVIRVSG